MNSKLPCQFSIVLMLASVVYGRTTATVVLQPTPSASFLLPPPPEDDCSTAASISGFGAFAFDTTAATTGTQGQVEATCLFAGSTAIEQDVWFSWVAPVTGSIKVETCGSTAINSKIAVYAGGGCPVGSAISCNDDACGLQTSTTFPATAGSVYSIQLGSFQGSGGGPGVIVIGPVGVPPANDVMCSPESINELEDQKVVDSSNATGNPLEGAACSSIPGNGQLQTDVWYCWTNSESTAYHFTLSQCSSNPPADTMPSPGMILYSTNALSTCGAPCPPVSPVCGTACSATEFCFTPPGPNQVFLLRIGSATSSGTFGGVVHLTIEKGCPDECQTKGKMTGTNFKTFDTGETTTGTDGQNNSGCYAPPGMDDDAWYDWQATQSGLVLVTTCGYTTVDTRIAVYAGVACPPGALVACDDNACGAQAEVCFPATAGSHYTIQVGKTPATADGSITFHVVELQPTTTCTTIAGRGYCAGDGVDPNVITLCPCGNFGAVGNGCANSFNPSGAHLAASGVSALDNVVLSGSGMNAVGTCIFLKGSTDVSAGLLFGDGVRCLSGALIRLRTSATSGGGAVFPDAVDTVTLSARSGTPVGSGLSAYYAVYYRNAAAGFCPPATFNVSNGWEIIW
ncbi:MAG: hypothetical protein IPJ77_22575 [Planctomycetes bacterium]|nr:hypothetical protein [Planctomycetota bacterium]